MSEGASPSAIALKAKKGFDGDRAW